MNFKDLDTKTKKALHEELSSFANALGGMNFFLQLIEDLKKEKVPALLNKTSIYHYSKGKLSWNKSIYKDTYNLLIETIKAEEKKDYSLSNEKLKKQKNINNMKKALKPISIKVESKDENSEGFSFNIIDAKNEENIKISFVFKIIFFYHVSFAKDVLTYKVEE